MILDASANTSACKNQMIHFRFNNFLNKNLNFFSQKITEAATTSPDVTQMLTSSTTPTTTFDRSKYCDDGETLRLQCVNKDEAYL